jgi:hypothetical protein
MSDVTLHRLCPFAACHQERLGKLTDSPLSTVRPKLQLRDSTHFRDGIADSHGEPHPAKHRKIREIVADERDVIEIAVEIVSD